MRPIFGKKRDKYDQVRYEKLRGEALAVIAEIEARFQQFENHMLDAFTLASRRSGDLALMEGALRGFMLAHPSLLRLLREEATSDPELVPHLQDFMRRTYILGYIARVQVEGGLRTVPE